MKGYIRHVQAFAARAVYHFIKVAFLARGFLSFGDYSRLQHSKVNADSLIQPEQDGVR